MYGERAFLREEIEGILKVMTALPSSALPLGVFWVSEKEPGNKMRSWLDERKAVWVESGDFDELMLLVRDTFGLKHPRVDRFKKVFDNYGETYSKLSSRLSEIDSSDPETAALKEAAERSDSTFSDWWRVELEAQRLIMSDPKKAGEIYKEGLEEFPESYHLMVNYANLLWGPLTDHNMAEELYKKAIDANPNDASNLGNYANFLWKVSHDNVKGEEVYARAFEIDPKEANNLGNYAEFLLACGRV